MPEKSRRSFLHSSLALAGATLLPTKLQSARAAEATGFWEAVRAQFPFREERIPMNAANLCPSPRVVADAVTAYTRDIDTDCSFNNRAKFGDLLEAARSGISQLLSISPDELAIVRNTSEANNIVNDGLQLGAGDEVLLWSENHPTNNVAWEVRAKRRGFKIQRFELPRPVESQAAILKAILSKVSESTRVIAVSHVSNVSGVRIPVAELSQQIRPNNIWLHVDGAQTWGALHLNLAALGCDSFSSSSHKWFLGPKEAGILYVRGDRVEELWPFGIAPGWGNDAETDLKGARKFESLGQRDDACLAAMGVAAKFHEEIGPDRIEARVQAINARLREQILSIGGELVTPVAPELSGGVTIMAVPANRRAEVFNKLYEEHGIAGAATGGLRLSPHIYNTDAHIERAVAAIRQLKSHWA